MSDFNFLDPLPQDLINKLHTNKVPEYKIQNALSEQENKRIRLAQHQLQLIAEQEFQAKKRKRLLQQQQEEKRQRKLDQQRKQQHNSYPNHQYKDDGPEL